MVYSDYIFGQNWTDQFKECVIAYEPTNRITRLLREPMHEYGPFGKIRSWANTRQGQRVWHRRCEQYQRDRYTRNYILTF